MRKISPDLLNLLKDQFQTSPSALLSGVFEEKAEAFPSETENPDVLPSDFAEDDLED